MIDIEKYLKNWSEKLSIPLKDIEKDYNELLANENEIHQSLSEDDRKQRALQRLSLVYKKQLRSPAVGFEGIVIGTSDVVDIIAKQRKEAISLFKTEPQETVARGITDENGNPLDVRPEFSGGRKNPNFGKPLPEHNYLRNVYGVVVKSKVENDTPKFFTMTITGDKAIDEGIPTFKPIRFMAIDRTPQELKGTNYVLNASTFTTIKEDTDLVLPDIETLVKSTCTITSIPDLETYHNSVKDNLSRIVIVEGSVSMLNLEPTALGSRVMSIEDEQASLDNIDQNTGVTCWIPLRAEIDFAEGSKVLVVGRTAQGKKKDDAGNVTEEAGDVTINTYGVYAVPNYKIELPNIEEITE